MIVKTHEVENPVTIMLIILKLASIIRIGDELILGARQAIRDLKKHQM